MVAGINLAVFKNTKHQDGAPKLREVHDQHAEQKILNGTYGSLPPVSRGAERPRLPDART